MHYGMREAYSRFLPISLLPNSSASNNNNNSSSSSSRRCHNSVVEKLRKVLEELLGGLLQEIRLAHKVDEEMEVVVVDVDNFLFLVPIDGDKEIVSSNYKDNSYSDSKQVKDNRMHLLEE